MTNNPWKKSTIFYKRKDIFSSKYYKKDICDLNNIAPNTILVGKKQY